MSPRMIIMVTAALLLASCKTNLKSKTSQAGGAKSSNYPSCESLQQESNSSISGSEGVSTVDAQNLNLADSNSCRNVAGMPVTGVITSDELSASERKELESVQKKIRQAYSAAVASGRINEGYKWLSNWWQGVNEICQGIAGVSPGAAQGYKCIDKQGALVIHMHDICIKEKWCLPKLFRIVQVDYNVGGFSEHHFLALFVARGKELRYYGNIDPWGNSNDPTIIFGKYNILEKGYERNYQCGESRVPNCMSDDAAR